MGALCSSTARKNPKTLAPGLAAFYSIAGSGKLQRSELESLLKAIGMRKSVLALAADKFDELAPTAQSVLPLRKWWDGLNNRSRIVIEAKLRALGPTQPTVLALGCTLAGMAGKRKLSASKADLSAALVQLGMEEGSPQLDEMLSACDVSIPLDKWSAKLSEKQLAKLRDVVWGDDGESPTGSRSGSPASQVRKDNGKPGAGKAVQMIKPGAEPIAA